MPAPQTPAEPPLPVPAPPNFLERNATAFAAGLIVFAVMLANLNTLAVPFLFDDERAILDNPTIRRLADLGAVLSPPADGSGVTGRPLVNLSLALNYAFGGTDVRGYHVFNVLLHALSALTLFGLVRRTLRALYSQPATLISVFIALLWALHPLQTESVTCVVQRTELLVGLFYLLTLYCFARSLECHPLDDTRSAGRRGAWRGLAVAACLLGMASKEVMVTAPVIVWLYDRTFVAGGFLAALRARPRFYAALAVTWLLLAALVAGFGGSRGAAAGFDLGIAWWSYALKQCDAIVHYLWLALWPHPLVLDYGTDVVTDPLAVAPQGLLLTALVAGTAVALWRRPGLGFLGACFFVVLAPSSSVVPLVTQTMAEHRMYLPLAAVTILIGAGVFAVGAKRAALPLAVLGFAFAALTVHRNTDYRSEQSIWSMTLAQRPGNARAHMGLGLALFRAGHIAPGLYHLRTAVRLQPAYPEAHYNLGLALLQTGRTADAIAAYEAALRFHPNYASAHYNLGLALMQAGRTADSITHFEATLRTRPTFAAAHNNLGTALAQLNRLPDAVRHFESALQFDPANAEAHNNLGTAHLLRGDRTAARRHYEEALRLRPDFPLARENLARLGPLPNP